MGLIEASVIVLDCAEPEKLADFYATLLDAETQAPAGSDRIEVVGSGGTHLALRRDLNAAPSSWPRPDNSQQAHLEFMVEQNDMDAAERRVVSLGGRPLETKDNGGRHDIRLYSDPAGHPFTLRCSRVSGPKID